MAIRDRAEYMREYRARKRNQDVTDAEFLEPAPQVPEPAPALPKVHWMYRVLPEPSRQRVFEFMNCAVLDFPERMAALERLRWITGEGQPEKPEPPSPPLPPPLPPGNPPAPTVLDERLLKAERRIGELEAELRFRDRLAELTRERDELMRALRWIESAMPESGREPDMEPDEISRAACAWLMDRQQLLNALTRMWPQFIRPTDMASEVMAGVDAMDQGSPLYPIPQYDIGPFPDTTRPY